MGQYTFPKSERSRILDIVNPSGALDIRPMDSDPVDSPVARWWRYTCDNDSSRVVLAISEHERLPDNVVVTVSTDLRRLLLVWKLIGDWRLEHLLNGLLVNSGGKTTCDAGG